MGAKFKVGSAKLLLTIRIHDLAAAFPYCIESLLVRRRRIRAPKLFGEFSGLTRSTDRPTHPLIVATRDNICLTLNHLLPPNLAEYVAVTCRSRVPVAGSNDRYASSNRRIAATAIAIQALWR